jgi:hypothetical protein
MGGYMVIRPPGNYLISDRHQLKRRQQKSFNWCLSLIKVNFFFSKPSLSSIITYHEKDILSYSLAVSTNPFVTGFAELSSAGIGKKAR